MDRMVSRRQVAEGLVATLAGFFLVRGVVACTNASTGTVADDGDETTDDTSESDASAGTTTDGSGTTTGSSGSWATGGTAAMTAKATYTDPFAAAATSCVLLTQVTEGPCTEAEDQVREDISEGYAGLPMRLAFRVVDSNCQPIANAKVKVWHTQRTGSYSGNTPNNRMCLKDQADAAKHYFRGVQTTDEDGRVYFDSCFPGWYSGRTPHIHYTVTANGRSFTSQVVFDQALVQELFESHPDYAEFGQPDTTNEDDNVVGRGAIESYVLDVERQSDGAMLASKLLVAFA